MVGQSTVLEIHQRVDKVNKLESYLDKGIPILVGRREEPGIIISLFH